jgi:hypothetical protein
MKMGLQVDDAMAGVVGHWYIAYAIVIFLKQVRRMNLYHEMTKRIAKIA